MNKNKKYSYPEKIIVSNIYPEADNTIRYFLQLKTPLQSKSSATIIMMNPNNASREHSDPTVNKVCSFFRDSRQFQYGVINILNLFPYFEQNSHLLDLEIENNTQSFEKTMKGNFKKIKEIIKLSDIIVLAWGNVPKNKFSKELHDKAVLSISNLLKKHKKEDCLYMFKYKNISSLTIQGNPGHPSRKSIEDLLKVRDIKITTKSRFII
ncbi:DUF1643 domain-containing protein [Viridibacillus sp. FSL R5-0477]|uniref:DUF1643 domain-containing protein n=1 Tax=Viridibacillus arenosi FSL R5-213 TaxID=1227360 RepID=W4F1V0_9BACL|nr:DUF1643 domain-containing protein [Viridibacillus arenosi]ETT86434.1 hypothetical protein C176_06967 [Viridibacillus arenosi FSL R5-213]OMC91728.1 hypothetical protein BK137_07375 [Viridibacillus arenosi]